MNNINNENMYLEFPSLAWAEALCNAVNKDEHLQEIGKGFNETLTIIVRRGPRERVALSFKIEDGKCVHARYARLEEGRLPDSDIVLEADLDTWLKILTLKTTPTKALFTRKLRIVKGDKLMIFSRPIAHYYILYHASRITNPQKDT